MPRKRFLNLASEARARLLEVATKHFAKCGFECASLNEILAEAGLSKGSYYYYFEDKDDLFATALESALEAMLQRHPVPDLDSVRREEFWPTVERFVCELAATFEPSGELVQLASQLTEAQRRSPSFAPMLAKTQTLYRRLIEPGQALGCVRTDLPLEVLVRLLEVNDAVLDSIFAANPAKVTRTRLDKHVRLVFDTFKRLLAAEPPTENPTKRAVPRRRA